MYPGPGMSEAQMRVPGPPRPTGTPPLVLCTGEKVKYLRCVRNPVPPSTLAFAPDRRASPTRPIGAHLSAPWSEPLRRITASLPPSCEEPLVRKIIASLPESWNEPLGKTVKILIFEDQPVPLSIYTAFLKCIPGVSLQCQETMHNPYDAILMFHSLRADGVITDMSLTERAQLDGITILHGVKHISSSTPVALATSFSPSSTDMTSDEIRHAGFDTVLSNKLDIASMVKFIRSDVAKVPA